MTDITNKDLWENFSREFDRIDKRFEKIDQRFEKIDQRFEKLENRVDRLERFSYWILIGFVGYAGTSLLALKLSGV